MEKRLIFIILAMFLLSSCATTDNITNEDTSENNSVVEIKDSSSSNYSEENVAEEYESTGAFFDRYIQTEELPMLDIHLDSEYIFDDRTIILEDNPENEVELMAFNKYFYEISAEFDKLTDMGDENKNRQTLFNDGAYIEKYIIHSLSTLPIEELGEIHKVFNLNSNAEEYGFTDCVIVRVDVSWEYNELLLSLGPQHTEGRYDRYCLFAKTDNVSEFKLFGVFWGDFLA